MKHAPLSMLVLSLEGPNASIVDVIGTPDTLWLDQDLVALVRNETEFEAVIFAEHIRTNALDRGLRVSVGIAQRPNLHTPLTTVLTRARFAHDFAVGLGGNLTIAHATLMAPLLRAA